MEWVIESYYEDDHEWVRWFSFREKHGGGPQKLEFCIQYYARNTSEYNASRYTYRFHNVVTGEVIPTGFIV